MGTFKSKCVRNQHTSAPPVDIRTSQRTQTVSIATEEKDSKEEEEHIGNALRQNQKTRTDGRGNRTKKKKTGEQQGGAVTLKGLPAHQAAPDTGARRGPTRPRKDARSSYI